MTQRRSGCNVITMTEGVALHHVCVRVSDLDAAEGFYTTVFGLKPVRRFSVPAEQARVLFDLDADCAMSTLACSEGQIELLAAGPWKNPESTPHFCFLVKNRDHLLERLRRYGMTERRVLREGRLIVFVSDPDGNRIELKPSETVAANIGAVSGSGGVA